MAWKDNKFSSDEGQKYMNQIFDLIFVNQEFTKDKIETENLDRQVKHFKNNMLSMVSLMKKFVVGYQEVPMTEAHSSGVHVCPHCLRRDFIWNWNILDVGHYASPVDWVSSVEPKIWKQGKKHEKDKYLFMARYECNKVTTCNKKSCMQTTIGHVSECGACGSSDVTQVGCGGESYAKHFIDEFTYDNNHPTSLQDIRNVLKNNQTVGRGRNRVEGKLVGYEYVRKMPSFGETITSSYEAEEYMPYVEFEYQGKLPNGDIETTKRKYPLSKLRFALSKKRVHVCRNGRDNWHQGKEYEFSEGDTSCQSTKSYVSGGFLYLKGHGEKCGANLPPLVTESNYYYPASLMRIKSSQPLDRKAMSGRSMEGEPVYFIHLEGRTKATKEYKILLPLPTIYSLMKIPDGPEPIVSSSSPPSCPNDVGMQVEIENLCEQAKKDMDEKKEKLTEQMKKYLDLGKADASTSDGYTFVICEGRSRKAYLDDNNNWIDDSPECKTKSGSHPRWNYVPSYADPDSTEPNYLGPNPDSHFVQDWLKASESIVEFVSTPTTYHFPDRIGQRTNEDAGVVIDIMECQTCKGIVEAGGVIPYRQKLNQCNADGEAINNFPQSVLDAEIAYQESFPDKNDKGEEVPTAWGIVASQSHNGKKMLEKTTRFEFS